MAAPDQTPADQVADATDQRERQRMRRSTAGFAVATIVSRIAGLAREIAVAWVFGVSAALSAFTVAFQLPNLIRSLVADAALNASFVPVFTRLREDGDNERAWRVASTMLSLIVIALVPVTLVAMWAAEPLVGLFVKDGFGEIQLAADLFRILLPTVLLMALSGIIVGILNAHDHFSVPALAPIAWNLIIIIAVAIVAPAADPEWRIHIYAVGVVVGTVVQVLLPVPWLRGRGGRISAVVDWRDPAIRTILILMLPVTISLGLINLNLLVNTYFSSRVPLELLPGADTGPAVLDRAFRIYMLPQGVFSVAVATVVYPALARFAARADMTRFRNAFADGARQVWMLLVPAAALLIAIPEPVVGLIYQYGAFTAADTVWVSEALVGLSVGLVFNGLSLLLIRAFFSLQKPWVPTLVGAVSVLGNALLVWLAHERWGVLGIGIATSIVNAIGVILLYWLLRHAIGSLDGRRTLRVIVASSACAAAGAGAAYATWTAIQSLEMTGFVLNLAGVSAATVALGIVYVIGLDLTRTVPARRLLSVLRRRSQ